MLKPEKIKVSQRELEKWRGVDLPRLLAIIEERVRLGNEAYRKVRGKSKGEGERSALV